MNSTVNHKEHLNPFIIPFFIPQMGCIFHCLYCHQETITQSPKKALNWKTFSCVLEAGLSSKRKKPGQEVEIAFYGGTFTNLPLSYQEQLLTWGAHFISQKKVTSLRLSTRPDALSEKKIEQLITVGVRTIELGVQSLNDEVLSLSNRGHTAQDAIQALALLKKFPIKIGVQLMMGLPGDNAEGFLKTTKEVIALEPDFVRIYPTIVFQDTPLAQWLQEGRYHPLSLDEAVYLCSRALELFEAAQIKVVRLGLQDHNGMHSGNNLIAGPFHPAFGSLVRGELFIRKILRGLKSQKPLPSEIVIQIAPKDISYLLGDKRRNLHRLTQELKVNRIELKVDQALSPGTWRWKLATNSKSQIITVPCPLNPDILP